REGEVAQLTEWVTEERCRVVSVLGLGGIGKSALAVSLMHQVALHFEVVLWRSLRDAPTCEELLADCYQAREELEQRLLALLSQLRERADYAQGYGPANVLALLRLQRGHLRGLDLSRLVLRGVSLQGVKM